MDKTTEPITVKNTTPRKVVFDLARLFGASVRFLTPPHSAALDSGYGAGWMADSAGTVKYAELHHGCVTFPPFPIHILARYPRGRRDEVIVTIEVSPASDDLDREVVWERIEEWQKARSLPSGQAL